MENRRKNGGLSDEQVDQITKAILERIYAQIGKSLVAKFLWACGTGLIALASWFAGTQSFKFPPH